MNLGRRHGFEEWLEEEDFEVEDERNEDLNNRERLLKLISQKRLLIPVYNGRTALPDPYKGQRIVATKEYCECPWTIRRLCLPIHQHTQHAFRLRPCGWESDLREGQ